MNAYVSDDRGAEDEDIAVVPVNFPILPILQVQDDHGAEHKEDPPEDEEPCHFDLSCFWDGRSPDGEKTSDGVGQVYAGFAYGTNAAPPTGKKDLCDLFTLIDPNKDLSLQQAEQSKNPMTQLGPLTDADTDWSDAARIATRLFLLTRALGDWKGLTYDQVTGLRREQERDLDSQPQAGALKNLRADWLAASAFASRCGQQDLFADIRPSETDIVDNIDALDKVMKTLLSRLNTTATRAQNAEIHRQEDTKHSHTAEEEDTCCSGALDDISVLGDDDVLPVPDTPGPLPISPSPCLAADATHTPTPSSDGEDDSMYHEGALLAGDDGGQIRKLRAAIQERVPNLSELTEDQRKELYKDGGWDDALRAAACFVELSHMVNATKDPTRTIQHFHVLRPDDYSAEQSDALADIQWAGLVAAVNHRAEATGFAKDNFVLSDDGASLFEVERLTEHVNRVWAKQESSVSKHDSREIEQGPVLGTSMLPHDTEEDRRLWERAFDEAKRTKYDNMTARAVCTSPVAETDENSQSNLHASGSTNDTGSYIGSALFAVGAMSVVGYLGRAAYNALTGGDEDR